jgi:DNA-binding GntR family transcriptional regulator
MRYCFAVVSLASENRPRLRYEQVMDLVEKLIDTGGLRPGAMLPTNNELAEMSGVSLISVRRALDELERAGRIRRHQGVGTFVAAERILSAPARAGSLLATLTGEADRPEVRTKVLDIGRGLPTRAIARALDVPSGQMVWRIHRLRVIGSRPMISEQSVIPVSLAPTIDADTIRDGGSLYQLLADQHGLTDAFEEQYLDVTVPSESDRKLLELSSRDRVARIRGVSFSRNGTPFDCFQQVYPADGFAFYISGRTDRHVMPSSPVEDWNVAPLVAVAAAADGRSRRARQS